VLVAPILFKARGKNNLRVPPARLCASIVNKVLGL
jgi:hypothetical protein